MTQLLYKILISIYRILPFKKQVCLILKKINFKTDLYAKDLRFEGPFTVSEANISFLINSYKSTTIENSIFWNGLYGWEPISMKLWHKFAEKSKITLDIGANTGIYSLVAEAANPTALIYGFEPSSRVYDKYVKNKEINNFKFNTSSIALSDKDEQKIFYDTTDEHQTSASLNQDKLKNFEGFEGEIKEVKVDCMALDSFIEKNNIGAIELIKIDTELHEPEVVAGYSNYLHKHRPVIFIEILNEEVASKINPFFKDNKYSFFNIDDQENKIIETASIEKSNHYNYLLIPNENEFHLNEVKRFK